MTGQYKQPKTPALDDRFDFEGDAIAAGDQQALRSALYNVEEKSTGIEYSLKLWKKTGTAADIDLRRLWLHEMRQVQRVMSYAGSREVIVDVLEFVEDSDHFGMLLERAGQPLSAKRKRVSAQHWLKHLGAMRPRILFWQNLRRIASAIGVVHAQGLVHGNISADAVMTEGADTPDFQLAGLEWSFWLTAAGDTHAQLASATSRAPSYSFAGDWAAFGKLIAECLDLVVLETGEMRPSPNNATTGDLTIPERVLLKKLIAPTRSDQLDATSTVRAIDDLIVGIARSVSVRAGTLILLFEQQSGLGAAVYALSKGAIPIDEYQRQLDWVRADLDVGVTLLAPRDFDPATGRLTLVTDTLIYRLQALRAEGAAQWDVGICITVDVRNDIFSFGDQEEHPLVQPVTVVAGRRQARELRAKLGPDALDWSSFAEEHHQTDLTGRDIVRKALLLVQTVEAVVDALEFYPVEILEQSRRDGRRLVSIRALPTSDRDKAAKKLGLSDSTSALQRLFEDDSRDAAARWWLSPIASLGGTRSGDVQANFVDVVDHKGRRAYQFELDEDLPSRTQLFLRSERDSGNETVVARHIAYIKALNTRVDLADMLSDPWQVRHTSHNQAAIDTDAAFEDLDGPKQIALEQLWSVLPSFFVVGPPGVGKTKLATEVIRRRFAIDRSARILISAQGHDALDNLQKKVRETLQENGMNDVLLVRSTTPDNRPTNDDEVQRMQTGYLSRLAGSSMAKTAPVALKAKAEALQKAAALSNKDRDRVDREDRAGLSALSQLILDGANIVVSTANSGDVERLVEAREQFDWVIVEEAAKLTGPELVGPLILSGRYLLIGDHHQLPPFSADRLTGILSDPSLMVHAIDLADQMIGPLLRDGEAGELERIAESAETLLSVGGMALRLLEPFRAFVEEDERRSSITPGHRRISETLTEQRRMDPAIARVVSRAFYNDALKTEAKRAKWAETSTLDVLRNPFLPASPVVVVNFPHVSDTGSRTKLESNRPRWHNPSEVDAVVDVLRRLKPGAMPASIAILSPYKAQVDRIQERISSLKRSDLAHLSGFKSVRQDGGFVGTVDSFQGSEADIVILSLVRNNPKTGVGAVGFLRDRRRMNVALSRAKSQLFIIGSLAFLREAVRGVNPDGDKHDLSFLTSVTDAISELSQETRNGLPLASIITPQQLRAQP